MQGEKKKLKRGVSNKWKTSTRTVRQACKEVGSEAVSNITSDTYYWVKRTEVLFKKKESQQLQTYTFESNRNIDLVEGEWELVGVKESPNEKRKKNTV